MQSSRVPLLASLCTLALRGPMRRFCVCLFGVWSDLDHVRNLGSAQVDRTWTDAANVKVPSIGKKHHVSTGSSHVLHVGHTTSRHPLDYCF